ncbi:MAG: hypothetical protein M0Z44_06385 [Gammaproteobacteria bacterium]|nr:hypothetical protein [Gammaproteobacteria bacterium]
MTRPAFLQAGTAHHAPPPEEVDPDLVTVTEEAATHDDPQSAVGSPPSPPMTEAAAIEENEPTVGPSQRDEGETPDKDPKDALGAEGMLDGPEDLSEDSPPLAYRLFVGMAAAAGIQGAPTADGQDLLETPWRRLSAANRMLFHVPAGTEDAAIARASALLKQAAIRRHASPDVRDGRGQANLATYASHAVATGLSALGRALRKGAAFTADEAASRVAAWRSKRMLVARADVLESLSALERRADSLLNDPDTGHIIRHMNVLYQDGLAAADAGGRARCAKAADDCARLISGWPGNPATGMADETARFSRALRRARNIGALDERQTSDIQTRLQALDDRAGVLPGHEGRSLHEHIEQIMERIMRFLRGFVARVAPSQDAEAEGPSP